MTKTRKRPLPPNTSSSRRCCVHVCAAAAALAAAVLLLPPQAHAFGLVANNVARSQTSLSVSTLAPPPHHMAWLQSQDEAEKRHKKKQRAAAAATAAGLSSSSSKFQQSPLHHNNNNNNKIETKREVLPLTMFHAQESLGNNETSAKEAWSQSFTTVEALRDTFGRNRNKFWGDLDASTTRRLYKTLLPRALLELYHCHGVGSEELAPMAYRARVAAKKYARERCELPARVGAFLYDGFRQFCKYGTFSGISYPQLWEKYATQIIEEEDFENEQDFTSKVCYKILQKSCETNKHVDSLFLSDQQDLQDITLKLEQEVYDLLNSTDDSKCRWAIRRYKILRTLLRIRRQMEGLSYTEKDDDMAMRAILEDAQE